MVRRVAPHLSLPRSALTLALFVVLNALALPLPAQAAKLWSGGLRIGTAQEGPQGTLKSGFEFGAVVDRTTGGPFDLGLGFGLAIDPGEGELPTLTILNLEGHARTSTVKRPVYLELGLGWYFMDKTGEANAAGGFVGGGYEWRTASAMRVGLGATYHMIAAEVGYTGGNMEDYFAIGATLRW